MAACFEGAGACPLCLRRRRKPSFRLCSRRVAARDDHSPDPDSARAFGACGRPTLSREADAAPAAQHGAWFFRRGAFRPPIRRGVRPSPSVGRALYIAPVSTRRYHTQHDRGDPVKFGRSVDYTCRSSRSRTFSVVIRNHFDDADRRRHTAGRGYFCIIWKLVSNTRHAADDAWRNRAFSILRDSYIDACRLHRLERGSQYADGFRCSLDRARRRGGPQPDARLKSLRSVVS